MHYPNFDNAEIIPGSDFTEIGKSARDARDAITGGALGWTAHWARFTVSASSSNVVTVEVGEYYKNAAVYGLTEARDVNLQSYKPIVATDERWVGLILRGTEEVQVEERPFETSDQPLVESIPVNQPTAKRTVRGIEIQIAQGDFGPPPQQKPAIAETDCCVAFVKLTQNGIQAVEANESDRVKTVFEIEGRVATVEVRIDRIVRETAQIATDVGNLGSAVTNLQQAIPNAHLINQMTRDLARLRREENFPDEARNYYFDQGLVPDFWDMGRVDTDARVFEGLRHQYEMQRDSQLKLFNPTDPLVHIHNNTLVLPAFTEQVRVESPVGNGRQDLADTVHTITTAQRHTRVHERIRYGETVTVCENRSGWGEIADRRPGEIFAVNGQEFAKGGVADTEWNRTGAFDGHRDYTAKRVIRDTYRSSYVTYNTEEFGLNGAIHAQSFLNSQIMVAVAIGLNFTRVGGEGAVTLCLVELNNAGSPDFRAVIADMTKPVEELSTGWVKFKLPPTLLEQGKRYAWVVTTAGNHQLATNSGNTFAGGTKFICTDGIFSQGSTTEDFAFRIYAAKFNKSRTVVQMEPVQLTGGMSEMDLIFQGFLPDGCVRWWEVQAQGSDEWVPMDPRTPNPLANLPALVNLRMVMQGTSDIAPAIVLDTNARVVSGRMKPDMSIVSDEKTFGFTTDEVSIVMNVDAYDPAKHTASAKVIVDGTEYEPDATALTADPTKPGRYVLSADFMLGAATGDARIKLATTTNDILDVPFVQDVQLNAF